METRGIVADWDPYDERLERLDVHAEPARGPRRRSRGSSASPSTDPRGHSSDVGGGFGQKGFTSPRGARRRARRATSSAAGEVDRGPAREPHRVEPRRASSAPSVTMAVRRRRPHPRRWRIDHLETAARSRVGGPRRRPGMIGMMFPGPYTIPAVGVRSRRRCSPTRAAAAPYRGPWMVETVARASSMLDVVARAIGIDPLELRRRNVLDDRASCRTRPRRA